MKNNCPLCHSKEISFYFEDDRRKYLLCKNCRLVFVSPNYFLSPEDEKARYDLHQNSNEDKGYLDFLNLLVKPLNEILAPESNGLDFGSGPQPILAKLFKNAGHKIDIFDHFYANDTSVFNKEYDFITMCEVIEHLHDPHQELIKLWSCLKTGGLLGIMTNLLKNKQQFSNWHYKNDLTHVCFFSESTLNWLSELLHAEVCYCNNNVIILKKY